MRFAIIIMLLFATACGKSDKANPVETSGKKGFGNSTERPTGIPFNLPAGITITGTIKGYSVFATQFCDNKTEEDAKGVGDLVRLCISFTNNNNFPVTITCPQGLIFIARHAPGERDSTGIQNGILFDKVVFEVPGKTTYYLPLYLNCLNEGREGSSPQYIYEMGPVTQDKDMLQAFSMINKKRVTQEQSVLVQTAIWDASKGKPQTAATIAAFNALPDR